MPLFGCVALRAKEVQPTFVWAFVKKSEVCLAVRAQVSIQLP